MQVYRSLLNSIKDRSIQTLNTYERFTPPKRFHSASCMRSSRKTYDPPLLTGPSPTSKSWKPYILPGAALGVFGGLILFLHYNDERRAIPKGQGEKFERSATQGPIIGGPFSLFDTEGRLVTERNLLGSWVLLYFGYTSSPDVGPAEVQKMAKTIDILGSKQDHHKILPVFVTIDPQRDTPSQLRAYLKEFDPRIMGLTGPVAAVRQMTQEYRVYFKKVDEEGGDYLVECSHNMYLVNPNMRVVRCFGVEYSGEELADAIVKELKKVEI
ncbi:protein SCO1 homolog 2, mitochondrial [Solanum lycopersicum]|uniref:Thioredoxin domain-containing protein n=1 Tax=Solanum lycopersicum TaxID=4081 RepID=A0A3Q7G636_SOLLC|nr:protein SCO1 homolog 2, mitochondrial isoform X1 [Solanum lycopersicum]XP_010319744.1 protein SCO1 homolog 2, mitochondrial isoform X1 [Solanum lycopersicum]